MIIEPATAADAAEILALQKLAYRSEAALYNDFSIEPLVQTLEQAQADFLVKRVLKAVVNGGIVGSVRCEMRADTCLIGKLIVHPEFQNRGLGTTLMREIEKLQPEAKRFELFTGWKSEKNLRLYHKLGYKQFRTMDVSDALKLVFLEKTGSG